MRVMHNLELHCFIRACLNYWRDLADRELGLYSLSMGRKGSHAHRQRRKERKTSESQSAYRVQHSTYLTFPCGVLPKLNRDIPGGHLHFPVFFS
jgi:hypothetical protein